MFDFFEQKQLSPRASSPQASSSECPPAKPKRPRNKEKQREWYRKNKKRVREIKKRWEQNHPEYRKKKYEKHKQWVKNKIETDPNYRQRMRDANKKYYAEWSDEKKEQNRNKQKLQYYQKKLEKLKEAGLTTPTARTEARPRIPEQVSIPKPSSPSIETPQRGAPFKGTQNLFQELRKWGSPIQPIQIHGVWFR